MWSINRSDGAEILSAASIPIINHNDVLRMVKDQERITGEILSATGLRALDNAVRFISIRKARSDTSGRRKLDVDLGLVEAEATWHRRAERHLAAARLHVSAALVRRLLVSVSDAAQGALPARLSARAGVIHARTCRNSQIWDPPTIIGCLASQTRIGQEIREHGLRPDPADRVADIFLLVGFICTLICGAHEVWVLIS
jgi:hypothetical protein